MARRKGPPKRTNVAKKPARETEESHHEEPITEGSDQAAENMAATDKEAFPTQSARTSSSGPENTESNASQDNAQTSAERSDGVQQVRVPKPVSQQ